MHDRQLLDNWLGDGEQAHGEQAPTHLLERMSASAFSTDAYALEPGKNVSFDALSGDTKRQMLDGLSSVAAKVRKHAIRADDADPTAIVVPNTHRHDVMEVPALARSAALSRAPDAWLGEVKRPHRAELTSLASYDSIELVLAQFLMQVEVSDAPVSVGDVVDELAAGVVHGVHAVDEHGNFAVANIDVVASQELHAGASAAGADAAPLGARARYIFVVFEADARGVFYCCVALRPTTHTHISAEYTVFSKKDAERLREMRGTFVGRAYFECPCV